MKKVPNRLECAYCLRHFTHGGECKGKEHNNDVSGCLIFKFDERGCIRNKDLRLQFPLYREIPPLGCWSSGWEKNGNDTEVKIRNIYGLTWDNRGGYLNVHCNCDYFVNEFLEGDSDSNKPVLKIIK